MKKILFSTIVCFLSFLSIAQKDSIVEREHVDGDTLKHYVGFGASSDWGAGMSYRYLPKKVGVQLNLLPIYHDEFYAQSTGLTFLYRVKNTSKINVYGYFANHLIFFKEHNFEDEEAYKFHIIGIGSGIDFKFSERMAFQITLGYGVYDVFEQMPLFDGRVTYLSAGYGLFYRF